MNLDETRLFSYSIWDAVRATEEPDNLADRVLQATIAQSGALGGGLYELVGDDVVSLSAEGVSPPNSVAEALMELPAVGHGLCYTGLLPRRPDEPPMAVLAWEGERRERAAIVLCFDGDAAPTDQSLALLGELLSLAIENAWLREERDRERRQNRIMFRVSQAFMSTVDLEPLLDLIVSAGVDTLDKAENCVLHLLDMESNQLVAARVSFIAPSQHRSRTAGPMRPGVGAAGLALSTGQVVNIADVSKDERFLAPSNPRGIRSLMTAPLIFHERSIGTLSVDSSTTQAFTQEDERLITTLATQAAAAIYNADLIKDLQESLNNLRTAQAQLVQSEKLSAIGQLIAGITHELNNPLAAISGYAQLLQMAEGLDAQTRQDVNKIFTQAQRAARIVRNLLTFAREHTSMRRPTDVNILLQQTLELQAYQLRVDNISVELRLAPHPLRVMGDPHQLEQVFFNLISNARDAMVDEHNGGRLSVWTELVDQMVHIHIADTGPGFPKEARRHLFEPFYTTKEVGKGTGLGLSICFGIVTDHDGKIWLEHSRGEGAEFVVALPYTAQLPERGEPETMDRSAYLSNRLVLLVEDEEPVARIVQRILSQDGHRVLVARDGREAVRFLRQAQERSVPFDLIISDIRMPTMGGSELYDELCSNYPDMTERVLFITGDSMSRPTRTFLSRNALPYLIKPFGLDELRQAVDDMFG